MTNYVCEQTDRADATDENESDRTSRPMMLLNTEQAFVGVHQQCLTNNGYAPWHPPR